MRDPVTICDLELSGRLAREALHRVRHEDWSRPARGLEWTCRETVNHMLDSLLLFAARVAVLETRHTEGTRRGDDVNSQEHLAYLAEPSALLLARAVEHMPEAGRAFHPSGMADGEGFLAMGVLELFVHSNDVLATFDAPFRPPAETCARVIARIFPWIRSQAEPWDALLWAAGRAPLGEHPRQGPDWWVQAAPLSEWDGAVKTRTGGG